MAKNRTMRKVKSKKPFSWGRETKRGKLTKDGVTLTFEDGVTTTLLTPSGTATKYAAELAMGVKITNSGEFKQDADGNEMQLTPAQRAFRAGYIEARKASARLYNSMKRR
ncbi:MAG: hypothetical protein NC131_00375 [Roseburia sp.]|nr:hypothetical protein [Roseburia sp.]